MVKAGSAISNFCYFCISKLLDYFNQKTNIISKFITPNGLYSIKFKTKNLDANFKKISAKLLDFIKIQEKEIPKFSTFQDNFPTD